MAGHSVRQMSDLDEYTMLIASLPHHGPLFAAKRTPINRVKLEARLKILRPDHYEALMLVVNALLWYALPLGLQETGIHARVSEAMDRVESETLRQVVRDRLEIRTCVAALRHRAAGETSPPAGKDWGYGRWRNHIARTWSEPSFRLDGVFPWLREADQLLRDGETLKLERLLLEVVWRNLGRYAAKHEFDFEAVVIYVLRWNVIARWTLYNSEAATQRFAGLVDSALGEHAQLFQEGTS